MPEIFRPSVRPPFLKPASSASRLVVVVVVVAVGCYMACFNDREEPAVSYK